MMSGSTVMLIVWANMLLFMIDTILSVLVLFSSISMHAQSTFQIILLKICMDIETKIENLFSYGKLDRRNLINIRTPKLVPMTKMVINQTAPTLL